MTTLPPHIAWPLFVILILAVGIGGAFSILYASGLDGGAQVIDDYYEQAVAWDSTAAARARTDALGWTADLHVSASNDGLRTIEFAVVDSAGSAVAGLSGVVRISRPQQARAVAEIPFHPADEAGTYRLQAPVATDGLWDFRIEARTGSTEYGATLRHLVMP